ncbi:MAG: hypothetical protein PVI23_15735 [Maricaulaceae bacterium]
MAGAAIAPWTVAMRAGANSGGDHLLVGEADRELRLSACDRFTSQTWRYAGQTWRETRSSISLFEHEWLRVVIVNDTQHALLASMPERMTPRRLRPSEETTFDLVVDTTRDLTIEAWDPARGDRFANLAAHVRPSDGAHALV